MLSFTFDNIAKEGEMAAVKHVLNEILDSKTLAQETFSNLRQQIFRDGHVSIEEADMIFLVDMQIADKPKDWNDFFIGSMTDFLIRQTLPVGYVDPIHSAWLIERIERDNLMSEDTEMELVLNVLRLAEDVPRDLEIYALNKVRDKVIASATSDGISVKSEHVDLMKRLLYASGGSGGFSICKSEARFLFDLDEICQNANNAPEWQKLFVGAIANHVMTMGAPKMASHAEYKRAQEFLHSNKTFDWNITNIKDTFIDWVDQFSSNDAKSHTSIFLDEDRMREAEAIDEAEAAWLIEHLNRDGGLSSNEKALLKFFKEECPNIHESFAPLIHRAA